jgi:LDH2 family malate/lactate/ureidoglycolate dehydrogenase
VDALIHDLRSSQRLPGVERIRLPGEGSHAARADRMKNGIPLPAPLAASLDALARDLKIAPL